MANSYPAPPSATLGTAEADIYSPSTGKDGLVIAGTFSNTSGATRYVTLRRKRGATTKTILNAVPVPAGGSLTLNPEIKTLIVKNGDIIRGFADAATSVDYDLSVVEVPSS